MIKVRALNTYEKNNVKDSELRIIPKEGYEFEVSENRYDILTKNNRFNLKFVEKIKKEKNKEENPKVGE